MARREQTLDQLEEMAWTAVCQMQKVIESGAPATPNYLLAIEKCHRMVSQGLKANPLDEEDLPDEELLLRLVETTERLRRKIQRKQEIEASGTPLERAGRRAEVVTPEVDSETGEPTRSLLDDLDS